MIFRETIAAANAATNAGDVLSIGANATALNGGTIKDTGEGTVAVITNVASIGTAAGTITVAGIVNDGTDEGNETVILTLSSPSNATVGGDDVQTFTKITLNTNHNLQNGDTISIADNSLIFTCTMDNRATEHAYPRSTDPASTNTSNLNNGVLSVSTAGLNGIRVNVGESLSGGFFAPLQMELIASILENSTS